MTTNAVDVLDTTNTLIGTFTTIQAAVTAASSGDTIRVHDGTYDENVMIDKSLTLLSVNGRGSTIISGAVGTPLGAIQIRPNVNNVTIGGLNQGFTIAGLNGNGAIEKAAVYIQGNNNIITIQGNELIANGDSALTSEFAASVTNVLLDNNIFSGKTFEGDNPSGVGFGTQFNVGNNAPRQLVVMGNGGSGPYTSSNIIFSNNQITGTAGGISIDDGVSAQGNNLVTIDADTVLFEGNVFTGFTNRFAVALRSRGPNSSLIDNTFDSSAGGGNSHFIFIDDKGMPGLLSGNNFLVPAGTSVSGTVGDDIITTTFDALLPNTVLDGGIGDDLLVLAGGSSTDKLVLRGLSENSAQNFVSGTSLDNVSIQNFSQFDLSEFLGQIIFRGGSGDERVIGGAGNNVLQGRDGNDVLSSTAGDNILVGGEGNDTLIGGVGNDILRGGAGDDRLEAIAGNNILRGGVGNDSLLGGSGNDRLVGGQGNNSVQGGSGNDTLISSSGQNLLTGGMGSDTFIFLTVSGQENIITDFDVAQDQIVVHRKWFGGELTRGLLDNRQFVLGSRAQTADHRFIYNGKSGELSFDADGSGSQAQQVMAVLDHQSSLSAQNIRVIG